MNTNTMIDEMTAEELKEYRKQKAKQTREANKARREAKRQQEDAERQQQQEVKSLVISSLRSVLEDPKSSTRQRLRAAQLLSQYTGVAVAERGR